MKVWVVAVGKVRDPALRAACDGYAGRAARYLRLEVREVAEPRGRKGANLLAAIPDLAEGIALTRAGEAVTSLELARWLAGWQRAARDVALVIGGADGLDRAVLARCRSHLSLSPLTLPHELARLVLLEQLYRAGTILRGEPYHRGARHVS